MSEEPTNPDAPVDQPGGTYFDPSYPTTTTTTNPASTGTTINHPLGTASEENVVKSDEPLVGSADAPDPDEIARSVRSLREAERRAAEARDLLQGPHRAAAEEIRQRLEDQRVLLQQGQATAVSLSDVDELLETAKRQRDEAVEADEEKLAAAQLGGLEQPEGTSPPPSTGAEPGEVTPAWETTASARGQLQTQQAADEPLDEQSPPDEPKAPGSI